MLSNQFILGMIVKNLIKVIKICDQNYVAFRAIATPSQVLLYNGNNIKIFNYLTTIYLYNMYNYYT